MWNAPPAVPPGARPTCGGSRRRAVPPAQHMVFQEDGRAVTAPTARLERREPALRDQVTSWPVPPVIDALQALRGGPCPVAVTTGAARGDLTRVAHHRPLRKCFELLPSASSSGARRRQGSLPQTGHPHARRARVEGAWASRDPAKIRRQLPRRLAHQPTASQDLSRKSYQRQVSAAPGSGSAADAGSRPLHASDEWLDTMM
jgi:transposase